MIKKMYLGRQKILICLSVFLLLYFFFISNPSLYFFLNDDFIHIPLAAKRDFFQGFCRPFSNISLLVDNRIWKQNAFGYHLTNILIHLVDCVLVFLFGKKMFSLSSSNSHLANLKSALAALLFLIYAFHSEPIFWIIGRGASLATLFFLLALLFYLKSWQGVSFYYLISLLFFGTGLLVYEVIWSYPLIMLILLVFFRPTRGEFKKQLIVVAVFIGFLLLRLQLTRTLFSDYELGSLSTFHLISLVYKFNTLLARCFLPPMDNSSLFLILYIGLLIGLITTLVKLRRNRLLIALFCCLVVSVLPVVPLGIDSHDSESERFIYMASVFAIFFIIELIFHLNRYAIQVSFAVLIVFHCYEFAKAAESYRFSSMVTRKTLESLPVKRGDVVVAANLPTQYKGALIFRAGFPQALQWFKGVKSDNVHVLSQKEVFKSFSRLNCIHLRSSNGLASFDYSEEGLVDNHSGESRIFVRWESDSLFFEKK